DGLTHDYPQDVARHVQIKKYHGDAVVHAKGRGRGVHGLETQLQNIQISNLVKLLGRRVDAGVVVVDPLLAGGFQDDFRLDFRRPQGRRRVGGKVRVAGARGEND